MKVVDKYGNWKYEIIKVTEKHYTYKYLNSGVKPFTHPVWILPVHLEAGATIEYPKSYYIKQFKELYGKG